MTDDKFQAELAGLFEREDKTLRADGAVFVAKIERKMAQRLWARRAVLSGAVLIGGGIAMAQMPAMLSQIDQYIGVGETAMGEVAKGITSLPEYIGVLLLAAMLSTLAVFSTDRV